MRIYFLFLVMVITFVSGCADTISEEPIDIGSVVIEETTVEEIITADELLDQFIDGEIMAYYVNGDRNPFYMTDLPSDPEDFTYCSVGERLDLDNDGENEQIIDGAYGGIYLDARDGKVYVLDEGDGTAFVMSYTNFDDKTWIVHSDTTHGGRRMYWFTCYDGGENVVDEFLLAEEYWDDPTGQDAVYSYRDEEITKEEYEKLRMKMLGY